MSESSLSIGYPDLCKEVGFFLGYGRAAANWSIAQVAEIDAIVQSGVRRVYYPPAVNADTVGYEWSFLRPTMPLALTPGDGDYDLPDDFGRLVGALHYPAGEHRASIAVVSIGTLLAMRASEDRSGAPAFAAVRYKMSGGTTGQRQEILFYPKPNAVHALSYEYEAYSGALSSASPYPLGGMQLAELYIESCLAVAETRMNDEAGSHAAGYQSLLVDAIARDRKHGAHSYGPMGSPETTFERPRHGDTGSVYPITYKGTVY